MKAFLPALLLASATVMAVPSYAADALTKDDYRNYCGYFLGLDFPVKKKCKGDKCKKISSLKGEKKQLKAIAKLLGTKWTELKSSVEKGKAVGATCDEVGKIYEDAAKTALNKALPGRIAVFVLDYSDPEFVVASVTWRGAAKAKLEEEAALVAKIISEEAPITKTIAVRAVRPKAKKLDNPKAVWFDGKINPERCSRINKDRINQDADRRYIGLFDHVLKIDERTPKLMKYDSRRRRWTDAPADALAHKKGHDKKKG